MRCSKTVALPAPCAVVKFSCARPQKGGGKVFDYEINSLVDGRQVLRTYVRR